MCPPRSHAPGPVLSGRWLSSSVAPDAASGRRLTLPAPSAPQQSLSPGSQEAQRRWRTCPRSPSWEVLGFDPGPVRVRRPHVPAVGRCCNSAFLGPQPPGSARRPRAELHVASGSGCRPPLWGPSFRGSAHCPREPVLPPQAGNGDTGLGAQGRASSCRDFLRSGSPCPGRLQPHRSQPSRDSGRARPPAPSQLRVAARGVVFAQTLP